MSERNGLVTQWSCWKQVNDSLIKFQLDIWSENARLLHVLCQRQRVSAIISGFAAVRSLFLQCIKIKWWVSARGKSLNEVWFFGCRDSSLPGNICGKQIADAMCRIARFSMILTENWNLKLLFIYKLLTAKIFLCCVRRTEPGRHYSITYIIKHYLPISSVKVVALFFF